MAGLAGLAGWLAGWLVGWLAGWLVGWLAGWLVGWYEKVASIACLTYICMCVFAVLAKIPTLLPLNMIRWFVPVKSVNV